MSNQSSFQVTSNIYLVRQAIPTEIAAKPIQVATNHIVVIDCSGSMSGELPAIRDQLKKKMPKLLGDKDTISVIWFSGKGQFGTLLEAEPVSTLADLQQVNQAIDRWLKPVCLTGFKEPLEEVVRLIDRIGKQNKNVFSLFFMSDGCDVRRRDKAKVGVPHELGHPVGNVQSCTKTLDRLAATYPPT